MTAARQQRKSAWAVAALVGMALGGGFLSPAPTAADERPVINSVTGLAISGFDPVAYFTDGAAIIGKSDMELGLNGAVWRFHNEGNRAAFAGHPEVYTPRFGGYDPVAIARGASVPGHPQFWAVVGQRLYLFYNGTARAAFVADPGRIIDAAERKWPKVAGAIGR